MLNPIMEDFQKTKFWQITLNLDELEEDHHLLRI